MGGAQPLAVTMNGGARLVVEVDEARARRRLEVGYVDELTARRSTRRSRWSTAGAPTARRARSRWSANAADVLPELVRRGWRPDVVTDQTVGPRPAERLRPGGLVLDEALALRASDPDGYVRARRRSMAEHVRAMLALQRAGAVTFDYGNNIRAHAQDAGVANAFDFPGFVPAFIRPLFCEGKGPFRVAALSGDPDDIARTDAALRAVPRRRRASRAGCGWPRRRCRSRGCRRGSAGSATASARRPACGSTSSSPRARSARRSSSAATTSTPARSPRPNRETEAMRDGSDAIADWPILNALVNTAAGATWVSFHHGGGVGIGYSLHAGMVVVADGTPEAAARLERVLTTDPGHGRHPPRRRRLRARDRGRP